MRLVLPTNSANASDFTLRELFNEVKGLDGTYRLQALNHVREGRVEQALELLNAPSLPVERGTNAWRALQVYLLHLAGQYANANQVLDSMIGLKLSKQLAMENCPSESEIMANWDHRAEGISVLCPTFNHARFINMTLAGIFRQVTTHPFEVIVRDDASTDETGEILTRWAERYPNLLQATILPENTYQSGQSPMLATMRLAKYPLLAMCEGDDFWIDCNKLQKQSQLLQKNQTWSAISHNDFELQESTGLLTRRYPKASTGFIPRQDLLNVNNVLWGHTLMVRRTLLKMPEYSIHDGVLGDQVMTCMLGMSGHVLFLADTYGSVARRNLFSTYTPLSNTDKIRRHISTYQFLAFVLSKHGEGQAAQHMLTKCQLAERELHSLVG